MLDFLNLYFTDILDIALVALLFYWLVRLVKGTAAGGIFVVVALLYIVWIATRALKMELLSFILGQVLGVGVIALIIIFQPEIRRFLLGFSAKYITSRKGLFSKLFKRSAAGGITVEVLEELTAACQHMSDTKTGALIVMPHTGSLQDIIDTGDTISAEINSRLIENIFFKNSPLHDGAMVISHGRITAAGCILPVSHNMNIPKELGLRHRAALGMSQESDAIIIIVSEETGGISVAKNGEFQLRLTAETLEGILNKELSEDEAS